MTKRSKLLATLLVLTILSTCVISGTFAKYTTSGEGSDSASVAKFGVKVTVSDTNDLGLFKTEYNKDDSTYTGSVSVKSSGSSKVVAPGTNGTFTFSVSGVPEVATKLAVSVTDNTPIHLVAKDYELATGSFAPKMVKVTTTADYEPIIWSLDGTKVGTDGTLAELKTALAALSTDYAPNSTISESHIISWEWAFEGSFSAGSFTEGDGCGTLVDFLDTYLGNEGSPQTESFKLTVSVTQID